MHVADRVAGNATPGDLGDENGEHVCGKNRVGCAVVKSEEEPTNQRGEEKKNRFEQFHRRYLALIGF